MMPKDPTVSIILRFQCILYTNRAQCSRAWLLSCMWLSSFSPSFAKKIIHVLVTYLLLVHDCTYHGNKYSAPLHCKRNLHSSLKKKFTLVFDDAGTVSTESTVNLHKGQSEKNKEDY